MTGWRSRRSLAVALLAAIVPGLVCLALSASNAACTSGTTPNCSDAGNMCDPYPPADAGDGGVAESSTQGG
jgi:hypothetical protein